MVYRLYFSAFFIFSATATSFSQNSFFSDAGANAVMRTQMQRVIKPQLYRAGTVDETALKNFLWSLPAEETIKTDHNRTPVMELPMPDGRTARFHVWESPVMEPGLSAKFPEIKTFCGQGIDDPYATIRMGYDPYFGFNAQVLSAVKGVIYIDPYALRDTKKYISYNFNNYYRETNWVCNTVTPLTNPNSLTAGPCRGTQLATYRLAVACTHQYAIAATGLSNPTVAQALAKIVISVNRVDGVYEQDLSVRLSLIANDNLIVYVDAASDPFTGNNNGGVLINESQTVIDNVIGNANYDIGHTFSTGGGGLAFLGVVCTTGNKARGITGSPTPFGDGYDIDYVAHEMGHQFGANHSFNSVTSNCGGGNRNAATAYEVGSGTTIMCYAGICGTDDIQPHSDPFFHAVGFDEISTYVSGGGSTCPVVTATGNNLPVITAMNNNGANIPLNTPFTLTGSATDADGDPITYCWEEWDLGPAGAWNSGASSTTAPLFKSRIPLTTGSRTFPDINVILAGYPANPPAVMGGLKGETLPLVARAIKFRLTVRDNRAGGGGVVSGGNGCQGSFSGTFQVNTIAGTGPFQVTSPNGGQSYPIGTTQTVTWNVAGSNAPPISTSNVKISLSTDGGFTYPTVLLASTANNGSASVLIPNTPTTTARIKVEAVGNIYFDISDADFSITVPTSGFTFNQPVNPSSSCPAGAGMQTTLIASYNGGFTNPITLSASGNPAGTTVVFGTNPLTVSTPSTTVTLTNTNALSFGTYTITVLGVASGASNQSQNISYTINQGTGPVVNTNPGSQTVCQGSNLNFTVAGTGALSYQWQKSGDGGVTWNNIGGAVSSSYTINNVQSSDAAMYRCVLTGQCGITNSGAAGLTVHQSPTIGLSASPLTSLLPGQTTTLTATPSVSSGGTVSASWYFNGTAFTNSGNTKVVNVEQVGDYQAKIQELWPGGLVCSSQSPIVTISAGVSGKLFIFPSPNTGQFTVSYYNSGGASTQRTLVIFDSKGGQTFNQQFAVNGAYTLIPIDLSRNASGIYQVVVGDINGKKLIAGKVLVNH